MFDYDELCELLGGARAGPGEGAVAEAQPASSSAPAAGEAGAASTAPRLPVLRVIDSRAHPAANTGPAFGANMLPLEMVQMSEGQTASDFRSAWQEAMAQGIGRPLDRVSDDEGEVDLDAQD